MIKNSKIPLPITTKILLSTGYVISNYWWLLIIILVFFIKLFIQWKNKPYGKKKYDLIVLKIPILRNFIKKLEISIFFRTLYMLVDNNTNILRAIKLSKRTISNHIIKNTINEIENSIILGNKFSDAIKNNNYFDRISISLIIIGEKTGKLKHMLKQIAETYEDKVKNYIVIVTNTIEPIMITITACFIGLIIAAVITPLLKTTELIH